MLGIGHRLIRAQQFHFIGHSQDAEQFGEVVARDRSLHFLDRSHGNRLDFGLDGVQGSVLDERVARRKLKFSRNLPNPDHYPAGGILPSDAAGSGWTLANAFGLLELGLATRPWDDEIDRQSIGDIVLHDLEAALGLRVFEGHPELVEAAVGQMKTLEVGAPDPASAVIRAQLVVSYNDDASIRDLDAHLARRDENSEIRHRSFWPESEALRDGLGVRCVNSVVLAILRGCRSAHETVFHALMHDPLAQRVLDHCLLVLVKLLLRDVDRGDANIRIVCLQQRVLQLAVAIDFHLLLRYCTVFTDLQRDYAKDARFVHNGHLRISFVLLLSYSGCSP